MDSLIDYRRRGPRHPSLYNDGGGRFVVLHETVFSGLPTLTVTGTSTIINGLLWNFTATTGGSSQVITNGSGLVLTSSNNSTERYATLVTPANGGAGLRSIIGLERFRRGRWALWIRATCGSLGADVWWYAPSVFGSYPNWAFHNRRARNVNGAANTTGGGWAAGNFGGSDLAGAMTGANSSGNAVDVSMLYFRSPHEVEHFYGVWANGWPTMEQMSCGMISRPAAAGSTYRYDNTKNVLVQNMETVNIELGGMPSTANYTMTVERLRVTAWD